MSTAIAHLRAQQGCRPQRVGTPGQRPVQPVLRPRRPYKVAPAPRSSARRQLLRLRLAKATHKAQRGVELITGVRRDARAHAHIRNSQAAWRDTASSPEQQAWNTGEIQPLASLCVNENDHSRVGRSA